MNKRVLFCFFTLATLTMLLSSAPAFAEINVSVFTTLISPQPVGTRVGFVAVVETSAGDLEYRFDYREQGGAWRLLRDYADVDHFVWTTLIEGDYEVRAQVRAVESEKFGEAAQPFTMISRLSGTAPAVTATANPLVALYSAAPCSAGLMRVSFRENESPWWRSTSPKACMPSKSMNFYVAGMRANTTYEMRHELLIGQNLIPAAQTLMFRTGVVEAPVPQGLVTNAGDVTTSLMQDILLSSPTRRPFAVDLFGRTVWYYGEEGSLLRPVPGGNMLIQQSWQDAAWQVLREVDLAGNTIRETRASNLTEQLEAFGQDMCTSIHHEALRLANGHTLVLCSTERILTEIQGEGDVDVLADMVVDLDENFQVAWVWNGFDHLDPRQRAILGETCVTGQAGCPPVVLAPIANDWMHTNSIDYQPHDGNIIISIRHQDLVVKIAYENGAGNGSILWKLGRNGDMTLIGGGTDPWPWFSHQHDAQFEGGVLTIYDNGNTRVAETSGGNSRGQVYLIDETNKRAVLALNIDLGSYAFAVGAAQRLHNGNYHFTNGVINVGGSATASQSVETLPAGIRSFVYSLGDVVYRSFRLRSLYSAPWPGSY